MSSGINYCTVAENEDNRSYLLHFQDSSSKVPVAIDRKDFKDELQNVLLTMVRY